MYLIEKQFSFEAGHCLIHHDGKCHAPHGHSYILKVSIASHALIEEGPKKNMITDFADLSKIIKPMIEEYFDHHWLNDTLKTDSPSAEYMTKWIFDYLEPKLEGLIGVRIFETATSSAVYIKDSNLSFFMNLP